MQLRSRRNRDGWCLRLGAVSLVALALVVAGCGGDDGGSERAGDTVASQADSQDAAGAQLSGAKRFLGQHTDRLVGFTQEFEGLATRYHELAAAESFDLERLWAQAGGRCRTASAANEGRLGRGQPVLRAGRGHRRGNAVPGRVRRHPRRRLERVGGSAERCPLRPDAVRRHRTEATREPLQPDRGCALGNASRRAPPRGSTRRPGRRRGARVRRGTARSRPALGGERDASTSTRRSSTMRARPGSRRPRMPSPPSS